MSSRFSRLRLCAAVLGLVLPAGATQFRPLSIEQLASRSDVVVHGTVTSKTCQRDPEGRIFTKVELAVAETWKGPASTNLTIVQSGGILGEEAALVAGQADYQIGEEVVAFLVLNARGEAVTLGLAHGKFHVWQDPATGEKLARNIFHGHSGQGAGPANGSQASAQGKARLTLAELKRQATKGKL